ncbi:MAG: hypothetical protein ACR2LR_01780 [Hassallia sp.]
MNFLCVGQDDALLMDVGNEKRDVSNEKRDVSKEKRDVGNEKIKPFHLTISLSSFQIYTVELRSHSHILPKK